MCHSALAQTVSISPYSIGAAVGSPLYTSPATGASFPISATSLPLPSNAAQETGGNLAGLVSYLGAPGTTACTTDTGTCSINALAQRLAQRLTSIISTLGSPFQAGGAVAQSGTWTVQPGNMANTAPWLMTNASLGPIGSTAPTSVTMLGLKNGTGNAIAWPLDSSNLPEFSSANFLSADGASFTAGTTSGNIINGLYQSTITSNPLSTGQTGAIQIGHYRQLLNSQIDSAGSDMTDTTAHALKTEGTGTAGTAASAVMTIQGIASMTPVAANPTQINGNAISTAASGVQKVGIVGNAGSSVDAAPGSAPTNAVAVQGVASMTPVNTSAQAATSNANAGYSAPVASTPIVTASAYSSGNCLGGFNSVTVAGNNAQTGLLTNVEVSSVTGVAATITVYMFEANPSSSTCTDKSTFTLNSADISKLISAPTQITLVAPTGATPSTAEIAFTPPRPFVTGASAKTIYYAMVAGGAFTPGSTSDIQVRIGTVMN